MEPTKRLHKSSTNKVLFGVAGGLGEYFDIDPTIFRIIFLFLLLFGGSGFLLYLIMAIVMPGVDQKEMPAKDAAKQNAEQLGKDIKEGVEQFSQQIKTRRDDGHFIIGIILLLLGGYFLLNNFGYGFPFDLGKLWPVIIIALGAYFLLRRR